MALALEHTSEQCYAAVNVSRFAVHRMALATTAVIYDLEYTAWEGSQARGWTGPGEHREIIQIGAIKVDVAALDEVASFSQLVQPAINPELSDYITSLTGITTDAVAAEGVSFLEAYRRFLAFRGDALAYSFGNDHTVIDENIALYGLEGQAPAGTGINIREWFHALGITTRRTSSCQIGTQFGLPPPARDHDAREDCRAVLGALRHLVAHGAASPFMDDGWIGTPFPDAA